MTSAEPAPPVPAPSDDAAGPAFTVGYVPGVMPGKWFGRWRERRLKPVLRDELLPAGGWRAALEDATVTACFVRLGWAPGDPSPEELRSTHHAVHLYDERRVAVLGTDDVLGVLDTLTTAQLTEEATPQAHADIDDAAMAVELAAAGVGPVVLPMSVARLHARKDVTTREITDAPPVPVFLVWPRGLEEETEDAVQRFVGVVRGRREGSGREAGDAESTGGEPARRDEGARAASSSEAATRGAGTGARPAQETAAAAEPATAAAGKGAAKGRSGGWAKAGASTKPGLRRKPGKKVKNGRNRKRR
ncbi:LysR substrate-binding domain-containing protein [Kocuria sp.]|uniref:LysR substrate-binding domain-containing protein n=1 Tax=Kocuria sp. TaxID=1871328 RepID=UPI0026DB83C4|nr:LysR substrate-binding domain-containing protein [Kocuria sp.]MDO4918770.1 LysR substrate-binding domain-containing protein [Kocuria sp.]